MINLIKNELTKIFHKKAIYILGLVCLGFILLNFTMCLYEDKLSSALDEYTMDSMNDYFEEYEYYDEESKEYYLENKTNYDLWKLRREYSYDDWEYSFIYNYLYDDVYCINSASINEGEDASVCQDEYDLYLKKIESGDWQYFIKNDVELLKEKKEYGLITDTENVELQMLEYRLENNIPFSSDNKSQLIDNFVSLSTQYSEMKETMKYSSYSEEYQFKMIEKEYFTTKYILDNNLYVEDDLDVTTDLKYDTSSVVFMVLITTLLVSGSILSEEFNKGTIKQLLIKPYTRTKILMSKYISCIIVFFLFLAFYLLSTTLIYGLLNGYGCLFEPVVVYDFATKTASEMNLFLYLLLSLLAVLPCYLILMSLAFCISVLGGSSLVSFGVTLITYFASSLVNAFGSSIDKSFLKYFPSMCWNMNEFLFNGISEYKYGSLTNSIIVCVITLAILITISIVVFNRKNIKNQ